MSIFRSDYKVRYRREESIAEVATAWLKAAELWNVDYFNIIRFVREFLSKRLKKGLLTIAFFDTLNGEKPAFVTYGPLVLHVDREVWALAEDGDPSARFVIAHEIGHIVLHDAYATAFSEGPEYRLSFVEVEYSAEWQANIFAGYFLLPTHIVAAVDNAARLSDSRRVPRRLAEDRTLAVRQSRRVHPEGDAYRECGNFTLVRNGTCLKCDMCDAMTGRS